MALKLELSASQLSSLDLLIAEKKKADPEFFDNAAQAVNNLTNSVVAAVAAAAAVAAVVTAHNALDKSINEAIAIAKNASLDKLLELRKNALVKK